MSMRKNMMLLAGITAFTCGTVFSPIRALASEPAFNKAVLVKEDSRPYAEYSLNAPDAAAASVRPDGVPDEPGCKYLPSTSGGKTYRFADGGRVVFPASGKRGIEFVAADGTKKQIGDEGGMHRKNWWCQPDRLVLFRTVVASGGKLSGVKVEWFDTAGTRITETQVNTPPDTGNAKWSYENSRIVDNCLGLTFQVRQKQARFVEYRICPTGI